MTPPLDGLLAGLRLALGTGDPAADRALVSGIADWDAVADLAEHHRVAALLSRGLRSGSAGNASAGDLGAASGAGPRLARLRDRDLARGMRQLQGLRLATECLAARDIPSMVLKGLPLRQRLWGHPLAGASIDIDLLVPPEAFSAAEDALCGHGWRRIQPVYRDTPRRKRWADERVHHHVFSGPGGKLELHRRLLDNPLLLASSFERLYANGATVAIRDHPYRTLGDDDQLVYLACHGLEHYWHRLKWLCDIAMLVTVIDDTRAARALARCREERLDSAVSAALELCREALHAELPPAALAPPLDGRRARMIVRLSRRAWVPAGVVRTIAMHVEMQAARIFVKPGAGFGLHEVLRFFISPYDFAEVDLPDRLFFLYVPLRPVLWLRRRLRERG